MELSIDTSTGTAGVALSREGRLLAEMAWFAGRNHTTHLHSGIEYLLKQQGVKPVDLKGIIVAIGPGSFSGLRVGVSAAKGMALALEIPLAAVSTLAVEAYQFAVTGLAMRPLLDAGRGELSTALYRWQGGMTELEPANIATVDDICARTKERTVLCGEQLPAVADVLKARMGELAIIPPFSTLMRRPGHLAELGWKGLKEGLTADVATLQPEYLRAPSITPPKQPVAVRVGKDKSG